MTTNPSLEAVTYPCKCKAQIIAIATGGFNCRWVCEKCGTEWTYKQMREDKEAITRQQEPAREALKEAWKQARALAFENVPVSEWGTYIAQKTSELLEAQGFTITRQPAMTDAELYLEAHKVWKEIYAYGAGKEAIVELVKKYRG